MTGATAGSIVQARTVRHGYPSMDVGRRGFLKSSGMGLLAFNLGGVQVLLSPGEARAKSMPYKVLTSGEVVTLEALGEVLLPGSRDAGIAHFVDHHLAVPPADCLLLIRYLDVPPPYVDTYRPALAALDAASNAAHEKPFASLTGAQATGLVRTMSEGAPVGWTGPPPPLFYFATRSDAIDVVYGTEEGFKRLGVPYMAHIPPPSRW